MQNANSLLTNVVLSDCLRFDRPTPEPMPPVNTKSVVSYGLLSYAMPVAMMDLGSQSLREPFAPRFHVCKRIGFRLSRVAIVSPDPLPFDEMVRPQDQEVLPKVLVAQRPATGIAPSLLEPTVCQMTHAADQVFAVGAESDSRPDLDGFKCFDCGRQLHLIGGCILGRP